MRSHPPALLKIVARTIADHRLYAPGDRVLVAVSGGPDSMALLHVLARLAPKLDVEIRACGVDHGLRPEAADELVLAQRFAADLRVPFHAGQDRAQVGAEISWPALATRATRPCAAFLQNGAAAEERKATVERDRRDRAPRR